MVTATDQPLSHLCAVRGVHVFACLCVHLFKAEPGRGQTMDYGSSESPGSRFSFITLSARTQPACVCTRSAVLKAVTKHISRNKPYRGEHLGVPQRAFCKQVSVGRGIMERRESQWS